MDKPSTISPFLKKQHVEICVRFLRGIGPNYVEVDTSRMALAFYCLSMLDLMGALETRIDEGEREDWRKWIWRQQISGKHGTGFRPGPSVPLTSETGSGSTPTADVPNRLEDSPNLIMTYTALLSLCVLRDDMKKLDRSGLVQLIRNTQREDGSFTAIPNWGESDLRTVYCAFAISWMLDDWSGIDVPKALDFVRRCRSYEGGYGQAPYQEAQGGTTYCALATLHLAAGMYSGHLSDYEREQTVRWLTQRQVQGFQGRTGKIQDSCYSFWCGASLDILNAGDLIDKNANAAFISSCQFKLGGIAKSPDTHPDPYHSYLGMASVAIFPPEQNEEPWPLLKLHSLVNATDDTAGWAVQCLKATN